MSLIVGVVEGEQGVGCTIVEVEVMKGVIIITLTMEVLSTVAVEEIVHMDHGMEDMEAIVVVVDDTPILEINLLIHIRGNHWINFESKSFRKHSEVSWLWIVVYCQVKSIQIC